MINFVLGFGLMFAITALILLQRARAIDRQLRKAATSEPTPAMTPVMRIVSIPPNPTRGDDLKGVPTAVANISYINAVCACATAVTARDADRLRVTLTIDGVVVLATALQVVLTMPVILNHSYPAGATVQLDIHGRRTEPGSTVYVWFTGRHQPALA